MHLYIKVNKKEIEIYIIKVIRRVTRYEVIKMNLKLIVSILIGGLLGLGLSMIMAKTGCG